ncbi:MAG TPA: YihY/virulence factor BrkB family protein [Vicinamibacterales bacterium]|nr:YihY/virulence factor BrkB family protein [Vicinamibacterales bacterium]
MPGQAWRALALLRRALRIGFRSAGRGIVEFYNSDNLTFAASIAYYTLLSLFPFLLLVLSILSKLAVGPEGGSILLVLRRALPSNFDFLADGINQLATAPLQLTLLGTIFTLWASMGVFSAITSAVNHAWGVEKPHGYFKQKLIAFIMLCAAGVLLVIALLLVSTVELVQTTSFAGVLERYPGLYRFSGMVYRSAPTVLFILVLGLIYYWVPNAQVRLRDVWFGAVLAGLLWRLTFSAFSWYIRVARFSVHGTVATVVIFLSWVYLSAVIVLYGVEVTAAYARLRKHLPQQAPAAPVREE